MTAQIRTLEEQVSQWASRNDSLQQGYSRTVLASLVDRIEKATKLLEIKADVLTKAELDDRIEKHEDKIESLRRQWDSLQPVSGKDNDEFQRLLERWSAIKHELELKQRAKVAAEDATLAPHAEVTPTVTTPVVPNIGPVVPPIHPTPESATSEKQSWMRIYALLHPNGVQDQKTYSKKYGCETLFKESDQGILITVNFNEQELTRDQVGQFVSKEGLNVESPSGDEYSLNYKDNIPKAVLSEFGVKINANETLDEQQQRLAVTVTNMIDNVLSKGTTAKINTKDPFIAKIAEQYIQHLKDKVGLKITYSEITGCSIAERSQKTDSAVTIFNKLREQFSKEKIEKAPWFKEAKKFRTTEAHVPPDAPNLHSPDR